MTANNNTPPGKPRKPTKRAPSAAALTKAIKDQHESPRTPPQIDHADRNDTEKWPVAAMSAAASQLGTAPGVTIAGSSASGSSPDTSCIDLALVGGYSPELVDWLQTRPVAEPVVSDDALAAVPAQRESTDSTDFGEFAPTSVADLPGVTVVDLGNLADIPAAPIPLAPLAECDGCGCDDASEDQAAVHAAAVAVRRALALKNKPTPSTVVEPEAEVRKHAHRGPLGFRARLKTFDPRRSRRPRAEVSTPAEGRVA